jgi:serine/threonine protein kinase
LIDTAPLGDRYELRGLLGSGGMANVYRAFDHVLHREVAVKVLRDATTNEVDRKRFATEALTLASLAHPGIVTLLDAGDRDEHPYLVLELIDGPTLTERLAGKGRLASTEVADLAISLAEALAYAHAEGIVHRDVKPSNILCSADRVVLTDFGIARLVASTDQHTRTGETIGSAAYLAPEQVTGGQIGTAADIYSLGLVLLEALTGERAYSGTPIAAAIARLSVRPVIPDSVGPVWRNLLDAMTQSDPADRPTAAEVARSLRGTAPSPAEQTALLTAYVPVAAVATPRRRRTGFLIAAAAMLAVAAGGAVLLLAPDGNASQTHAAERPPSPVPTPTNSPVSVVTPTRLPVQPVAVSIHPPKDQGDDHAAKHGKHGKHGKE